MNGTFPRSGLPAGTTIDVWCFELDKPFESVVNPDDILTLEERNRAGRFAFVRDATRFRNCRAMLRVGLAWYLQTPPREIRLTTGSYGKPYLAGRQTLRFNVSHAGGLGLIAFTTAGEVGIDVEPVQRDLDAVGIASSYFTGDEKALIAAEESPQEQTRVFLRFWTRKEAVLKAAGHGIQSGLDTLDVSQRAPMLVRLGSTTEGIAESRWLVRDLELVEGFVGAVAAAPGDWEIVQWPIRCEEAFHNFAEGFPGRK